MPSNKRMGAGVAADDADLEAEIARLGDLMQQAYAAGDRHAAAQHLQAQTRAIQARSPAQIARMESARGLGEPCFFHEAGRADRLRETSA